MAILKSCCCCCKTVRNGSFASGIYTLVYYTVIVTALAFRVNTDRVEKDDKREDKDIYVFSIVMLVLSGLCVLSSVLLLVGLCADNHNLLLPWIASIAVTTLLDVVLCFYLILVSQNVDSFLGVLFVTDVLICALNVYCLLCVVSQYQEYSAGRGGPRSCQQELPVLQIHSPSCHESVPKSSSVQQNGTASTCKHLKPDDRSEFCEVSSVSEDHRTSLSSQQRDESVSEREDHVDDVKPSPIETSIILTVEKIKVNNKRVSFGDYRKKTADRLDSNSSTVLLWDESLQ